MIWIFSKNNHLLLWIFSKINELLVWIFSKKKQLLVWIFSKKKQLLVWIFSKINELLVWIFSKMIHLLVWIFSKKDIITLYSNTYKFENKYNKIEIRCRQKSFFIDLKVKQINQLYYVGIIHFSFKFNYNKTT
ncbi:hypothetical protein B0A58_09150 [Flavobacterium branchiophilum NBRC 15030 = ATCC 35035]|nr:hypothetical protein B0A58_09150 [Flavobacterium branchiophilum NBRC 15030 = ATCC 35035]